MTRKCCLGFAGIVCILALACVIVATVTDFWYIVEADEPRINITNSTLYPYHFGLWLTCYYDAIPPTVEASMLVRGRCVLNYDFYSINIENYARTAVVSLVLSCGIMVFGALFSIIGCSCKNKNPLIVGGALFIVAGITTLIGMCCFIGWVIFHNQIPVVSTNNSMVSHFGWSFILGWVGLGLQIIAGSVLMGSTRGCSGSMKSLDNFI